MTAMFGAKKEEEKKETVGKTGDKVAKTGEKKTAKKKTQKISENLLKNAKLVNDTIISPIISEDAMNKTTVGKYVFQVNPKANKNQVAEAVQALYGVDVVKVNMMKYKQKNRNFRQIKGKQSGYKKAIVTIKTGQEIKLFTE